MKKILLLMAVLCVGIHAQAQKSKKKEKQKESVTEKTVQPSKEELAAKKAELALLESRMIKPMHQILHQFVGHWREEMKIWSSPGGQPVINLALKDSKLFGEGRFLTSSIVGQMGNQPYEAHSVLGFDNAKNIFVKTWYDNMGTSILTLEGTYNEKTNLIDFYGFTTDPLTKEAIKIHQVLKIIDGQNQLLEIFTINKEGVETKVMEVLSILS